jgi:hypothetical protein
MPGTNQDAVRARKANSNIGAGAFTNGSALLVDGVWNKEGFTGEPRQDFPQAAIREFKVFVSQSPAEYGWTAGGAVSFATKSGTNLFTGEAFEFFRHKNLNSQDPFEKEAGQAEPDFSRHQFGGAFGGPVITDRLHFFAAAERTKTNLYKTVVTQTDFYKNLDGTFPSPEWNNMVFGRGDLLVTQNQNLFLRYAWQNSDFTCEGCSSSSPQPWFSGTGIQQKRYSGAGAHTMVLSPTVLNEVRGQWTNYHFRQHPPGVSPVEDLFDDSPARTDPLTPAYNFPSASWGTSGNFYTTQTSRQLRDDMTITTGRHTWKFGFGFQNLSIRGDNRPSLGTWTFSQDQPFDAKTLATWSPLPGTVTQFASGNLVKLPIYNQGIMYDTYVEDEWKPLTNVTLQLGLRYDYHDKAFNQGLDPDDPEIFPTAGTVRDLRATGVDFSRRGDKNNFGPRIGLAWDLRNDGRSVVRAGYGVYYNPMNLQIKNAEVTNFRQFTVTLRNPSYPDPYAGQDPLAIASSSLNISTQANDLQNLKSSAYTVGLSQELAAGLAIHLDGVYNKMTDAPMGIDINPRANGTSGARPLPQFGRVYETQSIGWADYSALLARLEKRLDDNYMFMISYTLMDTEGIINNSGTQAFVTDQAHIEYDRGPNNSDRRHTLVASGAVILPFDINLSGVVTARSTMPFSALAGIDLNGDSANSDYVPGTTRNVFNRGNDEEMIGLVNAWRAVRGLGPISASQIDTNEYYSVDMRVTKSFDLQNRQRVELIAQVFNLFDRTNLLPGWQTSALSAAFGTIRSAANKRQAELAIRFAW